MAEGINASSPLDQPQQQQSQSRETKQPMMNTIDGINLEMYRFFNVEPITIDKNNFQQLRTINNWAFDKSGDTVNAIKKIRNLEIKLGAPLLGETRLSRLYNWVRVNNTLESIEEEKEKRISSVEQKKIQELSRVSAPYQQKIKELREQIREIKQSFFKAKRAFERNANSHTLRIKKDYEGRLKKLESLRSLYGGKK